MVFDCVIVGGGAVGLAAACFLGRAAADTNKRILVLEKAPRVGKKLLATGNGTCNITNIHADGRQYHGTPTLAKRLLAAFTPTQAMEFFASIGVDCVVRADGKVYPAGEQAAAVLDALRLETAAYGVQTRCECPVTALRPTKDGFALTTPDGVITARQVLVCTGGAAAPSLGGSADGYRLLTDLGCKKTPLFPSIVQLRTDTAFVRAVKGIRVDATVTLRLDGNELAAATGEVLFTDYGLSGPAVMGISRAAADWERKKTGALTVALDLLATWETPALEARIAARSRMPGRTMEDLLTGLLNKRVGQTILRTCDIALTRAADSLTNEECARVAKQIKNWEIAVVGTQGFGGAQVTAGGIDPSDFGPDTLCHRRYRGLYAAGEVLDVDGDCGGFNLQFAWSSAYAASCAIAAAW
ncbi:MAG: aminoacetone oxidase family FAD-binding enzyme [Clostridia bacterium]|nr:aminoacetone oxidase family FAD-binding enzyme [Clostridia bacterium]